MIITTAMSCTKAVCAHCIHAHQDVEKTMTKMKISVPYTFKKICLDTQIFVNEEEELKIGYININSLLTSKSDLFINNDRNLLKLYFLCIADTRLTQNDMKMEIDGQLSNGKVLCRFDVIETSGKIHMGLLQLQSKASFNDVKRINETTKHSKIIMGDLNLDANRDDDLRKLTVLLGNDKKRVLHEITTTRNNQLDHVLLTEDLSSEFYCTSFYNYTTDHRVISIRIPFHGNLFSEDFKKKVYFDNDHWTKKVENNLDSEKKNNSDELNDDIIFDRYAELLTHKTEKRHVFYAGFVWKNPLRFYPAGLFWINLPGKSQKNPLEGGFF